MDLEGDEVNVAEWKVKESMRRSCVGGGGRFVGEKRKSSKQQRKMRKAALKGLMAVMGGIKKSQERLLHIYVPEPEK